MGFVEPCFAQGDRAAPTHASESKNATLVEATKSLEQAQLGGDARAVDEVRRIGEAQTIAAGASRAPLRTSIAQVRTMRFTRGRDNAVILEAGQQVGQDVGAGVTTSGGSVVAGGDACIAGGIVSYTDSNFEPGEYNLQVGFSENEAYAAQYVLPAAAFPITIRQIDFLIGQGPNTEATTTQYEVEIWDGDPDGGINSVPVFRANSLPGGELIPITMGPTGPLAGEGVRVQIFFDPADADQFIVENILGSNRFSVNVQILDLNHPPADPCNLTPDDFLVLLPFHNAFPATDVSGVASFTGNWASFLDCPGSPCPSNWTQFVGLPPCQPSGDWVISATYETANTQSVGACCLSDGSCGPEFVCDLCQQAGGTFLEAQFCMDDPCPVPTGSCCVGVACLSNLDQATCTGVPLSGIYLGNDSTCAGSPCADGACCMPDGTCDQLLETVCVSGGGSYQGVGTQCANLTCPQPDGACCIDSFCTEQVKVECELIPGAEWAGPLTTCTPNPCPLVTCPVDGTIASASPPSDQVDARQPYPPGDPAMRQGIGSAAEPITVTLEMVGGSPVAGVDGCFSLCETAIDGMLGPNGIDTVTDLGGGVYEITLLHPITPGATTRVSYDGDGSSVQYTSHPGNANGDAQTDAADIAHLIAMEQGLASPVFGLLSSDMDHDMVFTMADLLRLVDLCGGGGGYSSWLNSANSSEDPCP